MGKMNRKSIFLQVKAPNEVKKTEHLVSWHTFRQNYKAGEGQLKNEAQQVHCQRHENGKAKYGLEAESLVNTPRADPFLAILGLKS